MSTHLALRAIPYSVLPLLVAVFASGCVFLSEERPARPLVAVEIPEPAAGARKPVVLLQVTEEAWAEIEHRREAERSLDRARGLQALFVRHAMARGLFKAILLDPFDAPKADVQLELVLRERVDPNTTPKVMVAGLSYGLISSTFKNDKQLVATLRDRRGRALTSTVTANSLLNTTGLAALWIKPPITPAQPRTVDEELVMKTLCWMTLQGIYRPGARPPAATGSSP